MWVIEASGKMPALRQALAQAGLPQDRVVATFGRLFDLADHVDRIVPEHVQDIERIDWTPLRADQIDKLKSMCRQASEIILATDADMEGELIAHHFIKAVVPDGVRVARAHLMGMTADHVLHALRHVQTIDTSRVFAATARRLFDRHLGYQLVKQEDHFKMSMGRVITPLISSLQREPARTTLIHCQLRDGWRARIELPVAMSDQAETLCHILSALPAIKPISASQETIVHRPALLTGPDAILLCARKLDRPITEIVDALQDNYMKGKLSYPRTDNRKLSEIGQKWMKKIAEQAGINVSAQQMTDMASDAGNTDRQFDAHEAIVPLSTQFVAQDIPLDRLNLNDAALSVITEHTVATLREPIVMTRETGQFDNDADSARWRQQTATYAPYLTLERYTNAAGLAEPDVGVKGNKPTLRASSVTLWRQKPDHIAAQRMIELGIGRPSTIGIMSDKAARTYMGADGQLNRRAYLMLHKVSERAPALLEPGVAQSIEQALLEQTPGLSVANRLKEAWARLMPDTETASDNQGHEHDASLPTMSTNTPATGVDLGSPSI